MAAIISSRSSFGGPAAVWLGESWPVLLGLLFLYAPTYLRLAHDVWQSPDSIHRALFVVLAAWMIWSRRAALLMTPSGTRRYGGTALFLLGLLLFVVGRSQDLLQLEVASQIPLLIGLVLAFRGRQALRELWVPIAFLAFLIPLPGTLLDAMLLPLKNMVAEVVEQLLFAFGYPIARDGVMLSIGPYQLLVANACAGLNSIIALTGVGLAFIYLAGRSGRWHNALLLAAIFPLAFVANVLRVVCLTLITFHAGDELGQRFHDIAAIFEVFFALGTFFVLDAVSGHLFDHRWGG
jgi:exosortase B